MCRLIVFLLTCWCFCCCSAAGTTSTVSPAVKNQLDQEEVMMSQLRIRRFQLDENETRSIYQFKHEERLAALEEYRLRKLFYERQLYYHPVILSVVVMIVLAGILFSAYQVWRDFKFGGNSITTFKIGRDGLELSSSVVGLISLTLSLLFFHSYATTVYGLSNTEKIEKAQSDAAKTRVEPTRSAQAQ